jgi:hemerythrin superfamily protein
MFSKKPESAVDTPATEAEAPMNAIDLLKKDHRTVSALFEQFENAEDGEKVGLTQQICTELTIHAEVEEKLFYPAARKALDEDGDDLIDEAAVEHRSLKMLIGEIDGSSPSDKLFDANVTVLKEYVEHHVKEEENEMFPKLKSTDLDLDALGAKMAGLKEELKAVVEETKPRAGAKTVHVPSLSGPEPAKSKSANASSKSTNGHAKSASTSDHAKSANGSSKSANGTSKSAASKTSKAKSASKGTRSTSRSAGHSAQR